jgi:hypothetical protein
MEPYVIVMTQISTMRHISQSGGSVSWCVVYEPENMWSCVLEYKYDNCHLELLIYPNHEDGKYILKVVPQRHSDCVSLHLETTTPIRELICCTPSASLGPVDRGKPR